MRALLVSTGSRGSSLLVPSSSRALQASEVVDHSHRHQPTAVPDRHLVARERRDVDRRTGRDLLGEDEQATVLLRELLEAARDVDRVAHRREIDALAVAHPSDDRGARVDADPDLERYLQLLAELAVERGEALHDLEGGGDGLAAAELSPGRDAEERDQRLLGLARRRQVCEAADDTHAAGGAAATAAADRGVGDAGDATRLEHAEADRHRDDASGRVEDADRAAPLPECADTPRREHGPQRDE